MSTSRVESIGGNTKPYLVGGSVLLAACAALYAFSRKQKTGAPKVNLTEEQVYEILRDFRKEFYPLLRGIVQQSQAIQQSVVKRIGSYPPNMKEMLLHRFVGDDSELSTEVENIELGILARHGVTDPDSFKDVCKAWGKKSPKVAQIMGEIRQNFEKAVAGVPYQPNISLPASITKDVIINHFTTINKEILRKTAKLNNDYRQLHGPEGFRMPQYGQDLSQVTSSTDPKVHHHLYPADLLRDYHVSQLFTMGLTHFRKIDVEFNKKVDRFHDKQDEFYNRLHTAAPYDYDKLIEEIDRWSFHGQLDQIEAQEREVEPDDDWITNKEEASQNGSKNEAEDPEDIHPDEKSNWSNQENNNGQIDDHHTKSEEEPPKQPEMPVPEATSSHPELGEDGQPVIKMEHLEVPDDAKSHHSNKSTGSKHGKRSRKGSKHSGKADAETHNTAEANDAQL
jgi:hypothetical protein